MTLVRLIVTGKVELLGLQAFLARAFPDVAFETELAASFTSCRIRLDPPPSAAPLLIDKFADALIAAVDPGRKKPEGGAPDFVVAIDDLELFNLDQPDVVADAVREAIRRRVPATWPSLERQERCYERLKERASFHLFCPMLEAYFFTSEAALQAAGVHTTPELVPARDIEDFETQDPAYLARYAALPPCGSDGVIHQQTRTWFAKHPKEYLKYLVHGVRDGAPIYRETRREIAALQALAPASPLAIHHQARLLRSLFHDLADALNLAPPAETAGECHPATRRPPTDDRLLRNL